MSYMSYKHIEEGLMAVMQSKTFKEHPLGVQLAAEHFANSSDFTKYVQLNKIYNFK